MKEVARILRSRRKSLKLTAAQVAEKAGITPQTVRVIERSKNPPKLDTLGALCGALGVKAYLTIQVGDKSSRRFLL